MFYSLSGEFLNGKVYELAFKIYFFNMVSIRLDKERFSFFAFIFKAATKLLSALKLHCFLMMAYISPF